MSAENEEGQEIEMVENNPEETANEESTQELIKEEAKDDQQADSTKGLDRTGSTQELEEVEKKLKVSF